MKKISVGNKTSIVHEKAFGLFVFIQELIEIVKQKQSHNECTSFLLLHNKLPQT